MVYCCVGDLTAPEEEVAQLGEHIVMFGTTLNGFV